MRFVPLKGTLADFRLYVLLAPHLANRGSGNTGWVADYKGAPMLFAERDHHALAVASTAPWLARSAGFVGVSDGWQELQAHKRLNRTYTRAENGNVAVTGEIDLLSSDGTFVMALGFGPTAMEAGQHALISLLEDFDDIQAAYVSSWKAWHARLAQLIRSRACTRQMPPAPGDAGIQHDPGIQRWKRRSWQSGHSIAYGMRSSITLALVSSKMRWRPRKRYSMS